jgi:lysophospholipase L1-like esterase
MLALSHRALRWALGAVTLMCVTAGADRAQAQEPAIYWRVENPFRFFQDPADTEMHRATFLSLSADEARNPIVAAERLLAERHTDGWAAPMYRRTCWHWQRNRHVCPDTADYVNPKSHRIIVEARDILDAQVVDCRWTMTPRAGGRAASVTMPCDTPVTFDVPYPSGADLSVAVGGQTIASVQARVTDVFIVGMGDSFASGEGNPDIPVRFSPERTAEYGKTGKGVELAGYPARIGDWRKVGDNKFIEENARWLDQACHRSLYSYQLRTALQLAVEDPHRAVTFAGVACSGAETTFGLFLRYKGNEWVPNPPDFSQLSALAEAQCGTVDAKPYDLPEAYHINGQIPELQGGLVLKKCDAQRARKIDLVLLSIGGNDVGFSRLVANAVLDDQSTLRRLGGWFGQVHGFAEAQAALEKLDDRYKSVNRALRNILHIPWKESDRIILTAYPPMAVKEDGRSSACEDGAAGMTVLPDFQFSEVKARESFAAAERLNDLMKASAKVHGWSFVESHRRTFLGRGLCATGAGRDDDLRLPRFVDGRWEPFNPSEWRAYTPRQRWFRTPNDAFMTGNFHVSQSVLQSVMKNQGLEWVQLLLAATYSGAFHPTAEGHAAIADAAVARARDVLARYDGDRRTAGAER